MSDALLLPQLLVAGVLVSAGVSKIRAPLDVRAGFTALRVPRVLSGRRLQAVFPWSETALGLLVLVSSGLLLALAGLAATGLMLLYLALVGRAVRSGEQVECACFGTFSAGAVGPPTVIRNTLLCLAASLVVLQGVQGGGLVAQLGDSRADVWSWLSWLLTAALAVLTLVAIFYVPSSLSTTPPGRATGSSTPRGEELLEYVRLPIPYVALETPQGTRSYLRELTRAAPLLLVFVSFGCSSCLKTLEQLPQWRRDLGIDIRPVVDLDGFIPADAPSGLLLDRNREVVRAMDVAGTPSAVLLGADGLLAGGPVAGISAIRALIADVAAQLAEAEYAEGAEGDQPADEAADQKVFGHRVDSQA